MKCPIYETRLLGRFAHIFYFDCEHVLSVYIVKLKKKFANFNKKFRGFLKFKKI